MYYGKSNDKCYHRGVFSHLATVSVRSRSSNSLPYTQELSKKTKQNKEYKKYKDDLLDTYYCYITFFIYLSTK